MATAPACPTSSLYFRPNSWPQERALLTTAREVLYSGHLGSSKTRTLCEKTNMVARAWANGRHAVCRKKRVDLGISTLRHYRENVVPPGFWAARFRPGAEGASTLFYPNGSEVHFLGLDNPLKLLSTEYDTISIDQAEEIEQEEWRNAAGRLRGTAGPWQQIIGYCNPADPAHWLYEHFRPDEGSHCDYSTEDFVTPDGRVVPKGQLLRELIRAGLSDNMANLDARYLQQIHGYKGRWYDRYVLGKWVAFEGVIYDCWEPDIHIVMRPPEWAKWGGYPPPDWPIYRALDFGFTNPFVCFDDQTEVLSERGWVSFDGLVLGERVATLNERREVEWQAPTGYIDQPYDGPMVTNTAGEQSADFSVTPNHQMLLEHRRDGRWKKFRADKMPGYEWAVPVGGWSGPGGSGDVAFARLIGLVLADGCLSKPNRVRIAQKDRCDEVRTVVSAAGFRASEYANKTGVIDFSISSAPLYNKLLDMGLKVPSREKRIPVEAYLWGRESMLALLEGLMLGDGSKDGRRFLSTSSGLADDVQALAALLGIPSRIRRSFARGYGGRIELHVVWFNRRHRAPVESMNLRLEPYQGRVRCVSVPNGILIVRRKGRPMACGNCQWWAVDPDDGWWLFQEIYQTHRHILDHARHILALDEKHLHVLREREKVNAANEKRTEHDIEFLPIYLNVADHDAGERAILEDQFGIPTEPADKRDVSVRLQTVYARMVPFERGGCRVSHLHFIRDALVEPDESLRHANRPICTIGEIPRYRIQEARSSKLAEGPREEPFKKDDHGCDAMGMLFQTVQTMGAMTLTRL